MIWNKKLQLSESFRPINKIEYPINNYSIAWEIFRNLSNETETLTSFLNQKILDLGLNDKLVEVLDIGTGDGVITKNLNLNSTKINLLEPNYNSLKNAYFNIASNKKNIEPFHDRLLNKIHLLEKSNLKLAIHVIYLLEETEFRNLIDYMSAGDNCFLIVDHPKSIFTKLWEFSAPKYYERLNKYLHKIFNLPAEDYLVEYDNINSKLTNVELLPKEIQTELFSFLSYSDPDNMSLSINKKSRELILDSNYSNSIDCSSIFIRINKIR